MVSRCLTRSILNSKLTRAPLTDLREAELLADLEQMCARDRAKMETQVEAFQVQCVKVDMSVRAGCGG